MSAGNLLRVYFGHADSALMNTSYLYPRAVVSHPYNSEDLAAILNVHLLLYEQIVIIDDFMLYNPLLRQLLASKDYSAQPYSRFLQDGSITVAHRDTIEPSFVQLAEHLHENHSYGVLPPASIPSLRRTLGRPCAPETYSVCRIGTPRTNV